MKKVIIAGMIGNGLEWYDYALYGQFAGIISTLFFPASNAYISLIQTYGVFAAGFAMRPIGAILFGFIGDRFGRRLSLAISILMMAIPTALIGFLPTYQKIGILAPVLLTVMRLVQGLALGGEQSGSLAFIVEHASIKKRGLAGSSSLFSAVAGILFGGVVGTIAAQLLTPEQLADWGWRVPFIFGVVIGLVGMYIRTKLQESPTYLAAKDEGKLAKKPLYDVFRHHWRELLIGIGIYLSVTVPFYTLVVFMLSFMVKFLGHSMPEALLMNSISLLVLLPVIPYSAMISDGIGRKPVLMFGVVSLLVFAYPVFFFLVQPGFVYPFIGHLVFATAIGVFLGPVSTMLVELFPTKVRYTGMALAQNICAAIFGGTTPMVATWMIEKTGSNTIISAYIILCAVITIFTLFFFKDKYRLPLH